MKVRHFSWFPLISLFLACGPSPQEDLAKLAPKDPEMAQILATPDSLWAGQCDNSGLLLLQEIARVLRTDVSLESEASYLASRDRIRRHLERVSRCLRVEYKFEGEWTEFEAWSHRTLEQAKNLEGLKAEQFQISQDTTLTWEQILRQGQALETKYRAANSINGAVNSLDMQAWAYNGMGNMAEAHSYFQKALAEREKAGRHTQSMALTIRIGYDFGIQGKVDSMLAYYGRALQMAKESRDPVNATRALRHIADHYRAEGQEAIAFELLKESSELCREFKGDNYELTSLLGALTHFNRYGAWDVVEDLLERGARVLDYAEKRKDRSAQDRLWRDRVAIEIGLFKGQHLMITGRKGEAEELFRKLRIPARKNHEKFPQLLYFWSSALLQSNLPEKAARLAREGVAYSESAEFPLEARRLNLILADAACRLGDTETAQAALDSFKALVEGDTTADRRQWMMHDAARVCLALAEGDTAKAERSAEAGLAHLMDLLKPLDQSVQACLFLDDCRGLREATHRVLSKDPAAGYGFEMAWRSLYAVLGNGTSNTGAASIFSRTNATFNSFCITGRSTLAERCASLGGRIQNQVAKAGAIHSVYFVDSNIIRWTAGPAGVVRERISMTSDDLKRDVETVTNVFADKQSGPWSPEIAEVLHRASILLPASIQDPERTAGLFLVSPDLYLFKLPFEALDLHQAGEYRPLIETCDVAYLRTADTHHPHGLEPGPGIALTSPQYPANLKRRYPLLRPLPYADKEAATVVASFPGTVSLRGSNATKLELSNHWENAPIIYVASHFIQSAETPYVSYLPLAAPEDAPLSKAMLDYGEIRKADLSGCGLVVLSGCGTGAAYTSANTAAPSLSDAFLDAGARAVVHTRWRVLDDEAYQLTQDFLARWARGQSVVVALNAARRDAWRTRNASSTWLAYAVTLSEIPIRPLARLTEPKP